MNPVLVRSTTTTEHDSEGKVVKTVTVNEYEYRQNWTYTNVPWTGNTGSGEIFYK